MIYGGHHALMPHPRPVRRKTSALDTYYKNGIPAATLGGMGMAFSDLPNGGHNLRLYTYDPIGSQFGPKNSCGSEPTNTWIYNTGHYDISLGTPCSNPDSQGFCDWPTMSAYAAKRGETLVLVSRADLSVLCGYRAPSGTVQPTAPGSVYTQPGGIPGPTTITPRPVTAPGPTSTITVPVGTTTTTSTTSTGGSGGGVPFVGGGGGGGAAPDNTLLYLGIAVLVSVMLTK